MMNLPDVNPIAVDIEASGLHPDDHATISSVGVAWEGGTAAFSFDQGRLDKFPQDQIEMFTEPNQNLGEKEWEELMDWMENRLMIFHNAKYDLTMLKTGTRHFKGRDFSKNFIYDTMLGSQDLEPMESAGLHNAAIRAGLEGKTGQDEVKEWCKKAKHPNRYDLVPWEIIEPYLLADAEQTFKLYKWQQNQYAEGNGNRNRLTRELSLLETLLKMEWRGVKYDVTQSLKAAEDLTKRANELEAKMPFEASINSAKRYFFDELGLQPDRRTEKGAPTLDEEQVLVWVAKEIEWAPEYLEITKARKAVSMWYQGYAEKIGLDGRLRCTYKQGHVRSGRMSVERVQLQAMPQTDKTVQGAPPVRELLTAEKGKGLWSLDLAQAELRVAAKYCNCTKMLNMLDQGADLHSITCEQVLGVTEEAEDFKAKRNIAKRLTFASIFGVGGKTFQATLSKAGFNLPLTQCEQLVYGWRNMYPEFNTAYKKACTVVERKGRVRLLPNTNSEVESWFGERDYPHTGWSRIVQGSLAEYMKQWLIGVERNWPGTMILTVHDSILLELPLDSGQDTASKVALYGKLLGESLFNINMPIDVERWG